MSWINLYNAASLNEECYPSNDSVLVSQECNFAICSNLTRSMESVHKLGLDEKVEISNDFIEAGLPSFNFLNLRLSEKFWLVFFRISWLLG